MYIRVVIYYVIVSLVVLQWVGYEINISSLGHILGFSLMCKRAVFICMYVIHARSHQFIYLVTGYHMVDLFM
jgi:hypothetical protein